MRMSFIPGQLFLDADSDGTFVVRLKGDEVLRTRVQKTAIAKYNQIRSILEEEFPASVPDPEEMRAILLKEIGLGLVQENKFEQMAANNKKRTPSRTFG